MEAIKPIPLWRIGEKGSQNLQSVIPYIEIIFFLSKYTQKQKKKKLRENFNLYTYVQISRKLSVI